MGRMSANPIMQQKISISARAVLLFFVCGLAVSYSLPASADDGCNGTWEKAKAKQPGAKTILKLSTDKDGRQQLKWANPDEKLVMMQVRRAKGPTSRKGEVEMCDTGPGVAFMGKSYAVADLKDKQKLEPGYYAISVVVGFGNDPRAGASGDKSNCITVQVD